MSKGNYSINNEGTGERGRKKYAIKKKLKKHRNNRQGYEPPPKTRDCRCPTPKANRFYEAEIKAKEQARQEAEEEKARQEEQAIRTWRKVFCGLDGNASFQQRRNANRETL